MAEKSEPFKFTDEERKAVEQLIKDYKNQPSWSEVTEVYITNAIEAIIADEVDNVV